MPRTIVTTRWACALCGEEFDTEAGAGADAVVLRYSAVGSVMDARMAKQAQLR